GPPRRPGPWRSSGSTEPLGARVGRAGGNSWMRFYHTGEAIVTAIPVRLKEGFRYWMPVSIPTCIGKGEAAPCRRPLLAERGRGDSPQRHEGHQGERKRLKGLHAPAWVGGRRPSFLPLSPSLLGALRSLW